MNLRGKGHNAAVAIHTVKWQFIIIIIIIKSIYIAQSR